MTDSKPENGWPDADQPNKQPTAEPTTGAKSYGGITGPPTRETGGSTDAGQRQGEGDEQPKDDTPRQEFPGEEQGSIGNRGPDPAEGEDRSTQPDTNAQSPNAGQPRGEDQRTEQQTGS